MGRMQREKNTKVNTEIIEYSGKLIGKVNTYLNKYKGKLMQKQIKAEICRLYFIN